MTDTTRTVFEYENPYGTLRVTDDGETYGVELDDQYVSLTAELGLDPEVARDLVARLGGALGPEPDFEDDGVVGWELINDIVRVDGTSAIHPPTANIDGFEFRGRDVPDRLTRLALRLLAAADYARRAEQRRTGT